MRPIAALLTPLLGPLLAPLLASLVMAPTPGPGRPTAEGFQEGKTAGVRLMNSSIVLSGNGLGGKGAKGDGYRIPRPCWYEPYKNAEEMLREEDATLRHAFRADPDLADSSANSQQYTNDLLQKYRDKMGQPGRWWRAAYNAGDQNGVVCSAALAAAVWVPDGAVPPPGGITADELRQIARAALTVPDPQVKLSPDARSFVNLPTWIWLEGGTQEPRSVTATLPGFMSVTVTATPKDVEIDPGTTSDRAEVRENCGAAGRPYTKGGTFTCGVRYLRASIDQSRDVYTLTVTSVWQVVSTDDQGGQPFPFDPIRATVTRDVPVGEVQSVVTG